MEQKLSGPGLTPMVRQANLEDMAAVLELVRELAAYEQAPDKMTATIDTYIDGFTNGYFKVLVADLEGSIIGIALYYRTFSTWKGRMMHLEDFVVQKQYRGLGVGKLLFEAFLDEARRAGSVMCKLQVLNWNAPAINFYRKYDTVFDDEWVDVKMYFE
jgi:GNAT superfamily N-acetyltransferase